MTQHAEIESLATNLVRLVDLLRLDSRCKWRSHFERCLKTVQQYLETGCTHDQLKTLSQSVMSAYARTGSFHDYSPTRFDPYTGQRSRIPGIEGLDEIAVQVFADALTVRPVLTLNQAFNTAL